MVPHVGLRDDDVAGEAFPRQRLRGLHEVVRDDVPHRLTQSAHQTVLHDHVATDEGVVGLPPEVGDASLDLGVWLLDEPGADVPRREVSYLEERVELGEGSEQVGLSGDSAHLEESLNVEVAHAVQDGGPILVLNAQRKDLGARRLAILLLQNTQAGDLGEAQPIRVPNKTVLRIVGMECEVALRLVGDGACLLVHLHNAHPAVPLHKLEAHNRPLL